MKTEDENTAAANDTEPTLEADVKETLTTLLTVLRQQDERIAKQNERSDRQDEIILGMQREIGLLGKVAHGHQKVIEADHPSVPTPPPPPDIVH